MWGKTREGNEGSRRKKGDPTSRPMGMLVPLLWFGVGGRTGSEGGATLYSGAPGVAAAAIRRHVR